MSELDTGLDRGARLLWWVGWHGRFVAGAGTVLGLLVAISAGLPALVAAVGAALALWYAGVRVVNRSFRSVVEAFDDQVTDSVRTQHPSASVERVDTLWYGRGRTRFLEPFRVYRNTVFVFTEDSLVVHTDAELMLPRLESRVGESTDRMRYGDISSASYDAANHTLAVERASGRRTTYPTHDDATAVVEVLNRVAAS